MAGAHRLTRGQRLARRAGRRLTASFAAALACAVAAVLMLAPEEAGRPVVTVYPSPGCAECARWITYLNQRGFQAVAGLEAQREEVRRAVPLPAGFHGQAIATVDGRFVSGFVPAREIHQLVRGHLGPRVIGVAVRDGSHLPWRSVLAGSGGLTVFAVLPRGLLRPVKVYHHGLIARAGAHPRSSRNQPSLRSAHFSASSSSIIATASATSSATSATPRARVSKMRCIHGA